MKGFYPTILKQAFGLTKDNKIFWVASLFLVWPNLFRALFWIFLLGHFLNVDMINQAQPQSVEDGSVWAGLFSIAAISLFTAYYYRSRAVVNIAVKQLRLKPVVENPKAYEEADPYIWELVKFGFVTSICLVMLVAFLSSPVMYLTAHNFSNRAFILGLFGLGVFIPVFTVLYYSMVFVPMFVAIHHMTVWDGFRASFDLIKRSWVIMVLTSILLLVIEVLYVLAVVVAMYLISLVFVFSAQIFYNVGSSGTVNIFQVLAVLMSFMVFFLSQAAMAVFQRVVWALVFFEIVRPVKKAEEEAEAVPVPEVIS